MSELMKIKLAEGRRVKDPYSQTVLQTGRVYSVKRTQFWLKRLQDKDVEHAIEEKIEQKVEAIKEEKISKKKEKKGE